MATALSAKTAVSGCSARLSKSSVAKVAPARAAVVVRALKDNEPEMTRRAALSMLAGVAALAGASPSQAAYGDAANVFGKVTNKSKFVDYVGDGYALKLPAKWNPSKEKENDAVVLRYEDNFDAVNNVLLLVKSTDKKSVEDFGSQESFLSTEVSNLFGKQAFAGETISEGGFKPNRVSAGSLLDYSTKTDKSGKKYYLYNVLVRSADGNEGGRHQLVSATVSNGKLYVLKAQAGDKRWFKGVKDEVIPMLESFAVA